MANLQKTLDALQPYVIGIRYIDKMTVVDTIFKTGWTLPESKTVKKAKGEDESLNYYMIFSDIQGVGLDEILEYVANVIKINIDREKKHELLRTKVNELKEFFKKHTLNDLTKLKFVLAEEELVPELNEFDVDDSVDEIEEPVYTSPGVSTSESDGDMIKYNADEQQAIQNHIENLTDDEKEMLAEEARAANYQRMKEAQKLNGAVKSKQKVELPPRKKIGEAIMSNTLMPVCDCGPLDACEKCIEFKDL
jgi:hypothetical protein